MGLWKKYNSGDFGSKGPKMGLKRGLSSLIFEKIELSSFLQQKGFVLFFSANEGPKWALKIDPKIFSDFLNKITVA